MRSLASRAQPSSATPAPKQLQEVDGITGFESLKLVTKFVAQGGLELPQVKRPDYSLGQSAVVMCQQNNLDMFVKNVGEDTSVLVIVNAVSNAIKAKHSPYRTQIVVEANDGKRTQMAWAIALGAKLIQAIQQAWTVKVVESEVIRLAFCLLRSEAQDSDYIAAQSKHSMATFPRHIGPHHLMVSAKADHSPRISEMGYGMPQREDT